MKVIQIISDHGLIVLTKDGEVYRQTHGLLGTSWEKVLLPADFPPDSLTSETILK